MFGNIFYHQTLHKTMAAFGTIFNDIWVVRRDDNFDEVERIKTPILYGPRESFLARLSDDPDLQRKTAITLPRMSFEMKNFNYDPSRKLNTIHKNTRVIQTDDKVLKQQFNPVPYNLGIELSVMTKYMEDANQIVEQILPWFTPSYVISANTIPQLNLKDDIVFTLNDVSFDDNYTEDYEDRREIIYTFTFTTKIYFYGPINEQGVIKKAQVDILFPSGDITEESMAQTPREERYIVVPDPIDAQATDDYGFTETWEEFNDGLKYNPVTGQDEEIPE